MKQYITSEQLEELTEYQREKLRTWVRKKRYGEMQEDDYYMIIPLSIGPMIEFLDENGKKLRVSAIFQSWYLGKERGGGDTNPCDGLWEAVKEVLNAS